MRIKGMAAIFALGLAVAGCGGVDAEAEGEGPSAGEVVRGEVGTGVGTGSGAGNPAPGEVGGAGVGATGSATAGAGVAGVADVIGAEGAGGAGATRTAGAGGASAGGGDAQAGGARGGQTGATGATGAAGAGAQAVGAGESGETESATDQDPAAILRATADRYQSIRSMQAQFEMLYENRLLRSRVTSRGTLYQRRPDRILLDFSDPEGDILVGDGTHFWAYYPSVDKAQAIRTPQARGSAGVDLQAQFVGDPVERFAYKYDGTVEVGGRRTHAFTLTPREPTDYTQLKVWIDAEDSLVRQFEFTDTTGAVRRIQLTGLQLNPTLDDARFRFVPPAGVRVVDRG